MLTLIGIAQLVKNVDGLPLKYRLLWAEGFEGHQLHRFTPSSSDFMLENGGAFPKIEPSSSIVISPIWER